MGGMSIETPWRPVLSRGAARPAPKGRAWTTDLVRGSGADSFDTAHTSSHRWSVSANGLPVMDHPVTLDMDDPGALRAREQEKLTALVRLAQEGGNEDLRRLLQVIAPTVRRTCRSVLGPQHADLEDTIQESLFAAVKALPKYRFDGGIHRYVTTIALRMAIAARRRTVVRWRQHTPLDEDEMAPTAPSDASDALVDGFAMVRSVLDNLAKVQAEALLMRVILGCSVDEIATMTGVSRNTVKTRLRRGKNALRRDIDKSGFWKRLLSRMT